MALWRSLLPTVVVAVVLVLLAAPAKANNPGVAVRFSQRLFDFAMAEINSLILEKVPKIKIPTVSLHIGGINTDMWIEQISISNSSIKIVSSSLTPKRAESGLGISVCVYIDGRGHYHSRARWWPHISANGWVYYSFDPMCLSITMSMAPGQNGLWDFTFKNLHVQPDTHINIKGGLHFVDGGAVAAIINFKANQAISSAIRKEINTALPLANYMMKKYLPYVNYPKCAKYGLPPACQDFAVNLSLISSGVWDDTCYAEVQLDGFVVYNKKKFYPQPAPSFPGAVDCGVRMVDLLISGSMFTSALDAILGSGLIHFNVQSGKYADDPFYNQFVPGLKKKFQHKPLYVNVSLSSTDLTVEPDGITTTLVSVFEVLVDLSPNVTKTSEKKFVSAFSMNVHITFELNVYIKPLATPDGPQNTVFLNFTRYSVDDVEVTHSNIGDIDADGIQDLMEKLMVKGFTNANELLTKGVLIVPSRIGTLLTLTSPYLLLGKGYLKLGIDLGKPKSSDSSPRVNEMLTDDMTRTEEHPLRTTRRTLRESFYDVLDHNGMNKAMNESLIMPGLVQNLQNMEDMIDFALHSISESIALGHDFFMHEVVKTMLVDY